MLAIALLVFREVLEAALIIGVVGAATRGVAGRGRWLLAGMAAGLVGALGVAWAAGAIAGAFSGSGQELFNAGVLLAAVLMIGWHVAWMSVHGRDLAQRMRAVGHAVHTGASPLYLLAVVVALAVLREGSEVALFLYGMVAGGAHGLVAGLLLGLVGGSMLGITLYAGLLRIPLRRFFGLTNGLLILLAAGLAASAARYLAQADLLGTGSGVLWDSSGLLSDGSLLGQTLHVLVGYQARPTAMMLAFYVATVVVLSLSARLVARRHMQPA